MAPKRRLLVHDMEWSGNGAIQSPATVTVAERFQFSHERRTVFSSKSQTGDTMFGAPRVNLASSIVADPF
jgi:hypothetical protein